MFEKIFDIFKLINNLLLDDNISPKSIEAAIENSLSKKKIDSKKTEQTHIKEIASMELPLDWENAFLGDSRVEGVHAQSISDGLIMSLANLGKVDIEYISAITGEDFKTVICALKGAIYQNPETWEECFYKGYETADEYLSGNLMRKYRIAQKASDEYSGYFDENIAAIKKIMPDAVKTEDIYITLGSPWVPNDIIDDFITHILNIRYDPYHYTKHDEITGSWEIPNKSRFHNKSQTSSYYTYGTPKLPALSILERTLNMKNIAVTDEKRGKYNFTEKKRVLNKSETILALEKQRCLIKEFQNWVWKDDYRKERLQKIYDDNFGRVVKRNFDGSFLNFPTMNPSVSLYPYQKDAVARIIFSPNTLLSHDVGSGKTYIMAAAGMELKRMGLSTKNLYVVPNNITGQWRRIFEELYPDCKLLVIEPKNFIPQIRKSILEKIRDENFDAIIMAYSCFEQISLSGDYYKEKLQNDSDDLREVLNISRKSTNKLKKKFELVKKELSQQVLKERSDEVTFDDLGITRLFIDEAHNFKNVPIETKSDKVLGINARGSKKCQHMMDKVLFIQKQNNGGGIVMATGTPITNSITEAYIFQKYLQSGELALLELQNFDSWVGMFAEKATEFEIDVDASNYRLATRFAKFHNLPELTSLLSSIADFHKVDSTSGIPDFKGYTDIVIPKTQEFSSYLHNISHRVEQVRSGNINRKEDNMLKITVDGRKAALDLRLVDINRPLMQQSKIYLCAENVYRIYKKTISSKSTQLIFCDISTPKKTFNVYSEIKKLLVSMGLPEEEVAFVHDFESEKKRIKLFSMVNNGDIRVLVGSTLKLGIGVNVQNKLVAIHHLDVPWRPSDMAQREGRILRQGNENIEVEIFRYITAGSFDAYSWQLLETKQRFITELLAGSLDERSGGDVDSTTLNYAEVKALAIGNPIIKDRVETANELARCETLQHKSYESKTKLQKELLAIPALIKHQEVLIENCRLDMELYNSLEADVDAEEWKSINQKLYDVISDNILATEEKILFNYKGFDVILPPNMTKDKPYVWISKNGKYYIELKNTGKRMLFKIDSFIENFNSYFKKLEEELEHLKITKNDMQEEINRIKDFTEIIIELKERLRKIDEKLGVITNERN